MDALDENRYSDSQIQKLCKTFELCPKVPGLIVEIGLLGGESTYGLANKIYPEILTSIYRKEEGESDVDLSLLQNYKEYNEDCLTWLAKEEPIKSSYHNNNKFETIIKSSSEPIISNGIKFAHVATYHGYEKFKMTIELLLKRIIPGGIICGDYFHIAGLNNEDVYCKTIKTMVELLPGHHFVGSFWYWIKPDE